MDELDTHRPSVNLPSPRSLDSIGSLVLQEVVGLRKQISDLPQQFRFDLREEFSKASAEFKPRSGTDVRSDVAPNFKTRATSQIVENDAHTENGPLESAKSWHPGSQIMMDGAKLGLPLFDKPLKTSSLMVKKEIEKLEKNPSSGVPSNSSTLIKRIQQDPLSDFNELPPGEGGSALKPQRRHSGRSWNSEKDKDNAESQKASVNFRESCLRGSIIPVPPTLPGSPSLKPIDNLARKGTSDTGTFPVFAGEGSCAIGQFGSSENIGEDTGDPLKHSMSIARTSVKGNKSVRSQAVLKLMGRDTEEDVRFAQSSNRLRRVVLSPVFDTISASMVILNAITIGLQTDDMARNNLPVKALGYRILDTFFCVAFTTELLLRILALRGAFFCASDWSWNLFDAVLVGTQILDEVFTHVASGGVTDNRVNFSFMRILRILRLVRIMRLIRILRLIGELRTIVSSLLGSMKALMWTIFLLFVIVYVVAVYLTQLVSDVKVERIDQGAIPNKDDLRMFYLFGSLGRSIFTLYQAISGGLDWNDIADPLMDRISVVLGFLLAAYTAFCLLALMNVVTGVFVEAALEHAKKDRAAYMLRHVRELFESADPEHTGCLDFDRFMTCLDFEPMQKFFKSIDVDVSEAQRIFALLDGDDSGSIDLDEFLNGCLGLHGPAQAIHLATLMHETRIAARYSVAYMEYIARMIKKVLEAPDAINGNVTAAAMDGPVLDEDLMRRKSFMMASVNPSPSGVDNSEGAVMVEVRSDGTTNSTSGPHVDPKTLRRKSFAVSTPNSSTPTPADLLGGFSTPGLRSAPLPFGRSDKMPTAAEDSCTLLSCMEEDDSESDHSDR